VAAHRIYFAAVERHVKERLVGAAVLVAAAVILIPEMLSGPREQRNRPVAEVATQGGEPPLKTYTIDLSQSPAAKDAAMPENAASPTVIQAPAPPPENIEPAAAADPASSEAVAPGQETPESAAVENQLDDATSADATPAERAVGPPPVVDAPSQRDVAPPATSPANHEARARSEQVTDKGWAVQLASLDSQSAANSMSKKLRDKGYDAFVVPFKKGSTTWYRVRVGPVKDRQAAGELQRKVKETTPGAIVVPHP
jgi:DedD protein